jgi:F0F1-type ATP synthase assembly protein I
MESKKTPPKKKAHKNPMFFLGLGMALTTEVAVACGIGYYLGRALDDKFHSAPYGMMAAILLFLTASVVHMILILQKAQEGQEEESSQ